MPGAYEHIPALRTDLDRLAAILDTAEDLEAKIPGLDWTVAQAATHLLVALGAMEGALRQDLSALLGVVTEDTVGGKSVREGVASVNAKALGMILITDPKQAAQGVRDVRDTLTKAASDADPEEPCPTPWYGMESSRSAHVMTSVAHGEVLIHGLDIARALNKPWDIPAASAAGVSYGVMTGMLPHMLTDRGRAFTGVFGVKLRGAKEFSIAFADGAATIGPPRPRSETDCKISMAPHAALLATYGRIPQGRLIATGQIAAFGRKPWLALGFSKFFDKP